MMPKVLFMRQPQAATAESSSKSIRKSMPTLHTSPLLDTGTDWAGLADPSSCQRKNRSQGMGSLGRQTNWVLDNRDFGRPDADVEDVGADRAGDGHV